MGSELLQKSRVYLIGCEEVIMRKYTIKNNFIQESEAKYYWIGFLAADGCVYKNRIQLELADDSEHIAKFLAFMESNSPVRFNEKRNSYSVCLSSSEVVATLKDYNIIPNKTECYEIPSTIPSEYFRHFLRGYFDGDGSIYKRADSNCWCMSIVANEKVIDFIGKMLVTAKVITKYKKAFCSNTKHTYKIDFLAKESANLAKYLYGDCSIALTRKYNLAAQLLDFKKELPITLASINLLGVKIPVDLSLTDEALTEKYEEEDLVVGM